MSVKWTTPALVTIIAVLAIALGLKSCERSPEAKIPPALQKTIDSLATTAPAFVAHRDSVIRVTVQDTTAARKANARADAAIATADRLQRIADSLTDLARSNADSVAWERALAAQRHVSDSLRLALAAKDAAYQTERLNTIRLLGVVQGDSLRINAVVDANNRLQKRISELEVPCRVLGPIPCPSRTVTFVVTAVLTTVAENAVPRRK